MFPHCVKLPVATVFWDHNLGDLQLRIRRKYVYLPYDFEFCLFDSRLHTSESNSRRPIYKKREKKINLESNHLSNSSDSFWWSLHISGFTFTAGLVYITRSQNQELKMNFSVSTIFAKFFKNCVKSNDLILNYIVSCFHEIFQHGLLNRQEGRIF